jgi:hypothetical protein
VSRFVGMIISIARGLDYSNRQYAPAWHSMDWGTHMKLKSITFCVAMAFLATLIPHPGRAVTPDEIVKLAKLGEVAEVYLRCAAMASESFEFDDKRRFIEQGLIGAREVVAAIRERKVSTPEQLAEMPRIFKVYQDSPTVDFLLWSVFDALIDNARAAVENILEQRTSARPNQSTYASERLAAAKELYRSKNCHVIK